MRRFLVAGAVTLAAIMSTAGSASATPAFKLRVEAPGTTLDPGTHYAVRDPIGAQRGELQGAGNCVRASGDLTLGGKTALGLAASAANASAALRPLLIVEDSFGRRICRIDGFNETDSPFTGWLFRVNHVAPPMSAELVPIQPTDEVLWVFANFGTGANTGDELVLSGPFRVAPGTIQVSVTAIAFDGASSPAPDGTVITGGTSPQRLWAASRRWSSAEHHATGGWSGRRADQIPSNELPSACWRIRRIARPCRKRIVDQPPRQLQGDGWPDRIRTRGGRTRCA
jgi:hypothetical protein